MATEGLICNMKGCRKGISGKAYVTSCSHVFCEEDGQKQFNRAMVCPACETRYAVSFIRFICLLQNLKKCNLCSKFRIVKVRMDYYKVLYRIFKKSWCLLKYLEVDAMKFLDIKTDIILWCIVINKHLKCFFTVSHENSILFWWM